MGKNIVGMVSPGRYNSGASDSASLAGGGGTSLLTLGEGIEGGTSDGVRSGDCASAISSSAGETLSPSGEAPSDEASSPSDKAPSEPSTMNGSGTSGSNTCDCDGVPGPSPRSSGKV